MSKLVLREEKAGISILTLNRPDALNALSPSLFVELRKHIDSIAKSEDEVGCVILQAAGRSFSAGNDLKALQKGEVPPGEHFQADTIDALEGIAEAARRCRTELVGGNENGVGDAIAAEWGARKRPAPEVCPPDLEVIIDAGIAAGAYAIKACGAGGGGSVLAWHPPEARAAVSSALDAASAHGRVVATDVEKIGCRVLAGG